MIKNRDEKINILAITYGANPSSGGIERYCYTVFKYLLNHNIKITTYSFSSHCPQSGEYLINPWKNFDQYWLYQHLRLSTLFLNVDYILCCHLFLSPLADRLAHALNIEFILNLYGIECWGRRTTAYLKYLERMKIACSISSFTTEQVISQGLLGDRILYLPPAVTDPNLFIPLPKSKNIERGNPFILLTVGRMAANEQYKGHDMVIESLPKILNQGINVEYHIVGCGNDIPRLQKIAHKFKVSNQVHFLGFVRDEDLPQIYASADAFIMPSRVSLEPINPQGEGFGIVFVEAALMEKPLIGPDIGGTMDIIQHGINGITVNPRNPEEISKAVVYLANNPDLCVQMGRNARLMCLQKYSLDCLSHYIDPLVSILSENR